MDARVGFLEEEVKASEGQIMPFIQGIDDDQTRLIFRRAFLRGARMERGRSGHRRPQFGGFGKDGVLPLPRQLKAVLRCCNSFLDIPRTMY